MLNAFVDHTLATLLPSDAAVWLVLYRDTTNGIARTAQADIARRAGVSRRTVARALIRLGVLGLVQVVRRGGLNRGLSSYRVHPLVR
ncbi:MAG: GntR family transcriptional regulator, partial [Candidatus Hydrogenedentes bacterium]|nr:GntR family transcriptional regulator [Candidatus Hydrogenedentota bacterium]